MDDPSRHRAELWGTVTPPPAYPGAIAAPGRPLQDDVLRLEPLSEEHLPLIVSGVSARERGTWVPRPGPYNESVARVLVGDADERLARGESVLLAVCSHHEPGLAGGLVLSATGPGHAEIGYWIAKKMRGRRYATRALILLTDWALHELGLDCVWVEIDAQNEASIAVARNAGFERVDVNADGLDALERGALIASLAAQPVSSRPPASGPGEPACLFFARLRRAPVPPGYFLRAATMSDLEEVAALVVAVETADSGSSLTTPEEVRTDWTALLRFDLSRDTWLLVDQTAPRPQVVGYAWLRDEVGHAQLMSNVMVHPEAREHGLEEVLLDRVEARAREHAACAAEGRAVLGTYTEEQMADRVRLLVAHGFRKTREFERMGIELPRPYPGGETPPGITLGPFREGADEVPVYEALEEAFSEHFWDAPLSFDEWRHLAVEDARYDPGLWVVARDGQEIVGVAISIIHRESLTGYVDSLAVRKRWRGRHIGAALLTASFDVLAGRGCRRAVLGVDRQNVTPALPLYERAGMLAEQRTDFFEKEVWAPRRG